eukprot:TRINITY_DN85_c0_g1_i4.p1 TRINITY_DN85_c0_g1~~TRINITY_DN85_c0_g1_i4.p1  ORF type:complete len:387 (+),score=73.18 TRINITY_DN85_c0_g1_i4:64-1224(+)
MQLSLCCTEPQQPMDRSRCGDAAVGCADEAARGRTAAPCRTFRSYSAPAELRRADDGAAPSSPMWADGGYPRASSALFGAEDNCHMYAADEYAGSEEWGNSARHTASAASSAAGDGCDTFGGNDASAGWGGSISAASTGAEGSCHMSGSASPYSYALDSSTASPGSGRLGYSCASGSGAASAADSHTPAGSAPPSPGWAAVGCMCGAGGAASVCACVGCPHMHSSVFPAWGDAQMLPPSPPATPPPPSPSPALSPGLPRGEDCVWWSPKVEGEKKKHRYLRMVPIAASRSKRDPRATPNRQVKGGRIFIDAQREARKVERVMRRHAPSVCVLPQLSWVGGEPWTTAQGHSIAVPVLYVPVRGCRAVPEAAWLESCDAVSPFRVQFV